MKINPNYDAFGKDVVSWEYGQEGGKSRLLNRDTLLKNLVEVRDVFNKYDIKHCLSHGTCLGAIRENNFIAWDDDADIWLDFSQRPLFNMVAKDLRKLGYWVPVSDPNKPISKNNAPYYDFVAIKGGEKIEGWFFEKKGDFYIYDEPRCGNDLKHPAKFYNQLQYFDLRGYRFCIPNFVEEYLELMYGEGWGIPDPNKKYNNQS